LNGFVRKPYFNGSPIVYFTFSAQTLRPSLSRLLTIFRNRGFKKVMWISLVHGLRTIDHDHESKL